MGEHNIRNRLHHLRNTANRKHTDPDWHAIEQVGDDADARIAELEQENARLRENDARLKAMMPLFEEARDALPAITVVSMRLRGISASLADRMDEIGIANQWKKRYAAEAARMEQSDD